jgi:hypothetical protein
MKNISIFAFSLLILFSACKKDDPIQTPAAVSKKLTGFTYENNQYTPETIEYDAQGRVSRYVGEDIITFTYLGNELKISAWRVDENREVFNFKGQLNAQGNVYKGTATSKYNAGTTNQEEYTFEYDADDFMTRETRNINQGANIYVTDYFYNKDGNMSEYKVYSNGVFSYGGSWVYDTSKKEKSGLNWEQFMGPNTFTGKTNQHMAIKYTGNTGWFVDMSYTYDQQGYPSSSTLNYSNGNKSKYFFIFE